MKLKFNTDIQLGTKKINSSSPVFIIAEAGVNHNGNLDLAFKMIDEALVAGADAVKFQAFHTEELILDTVEKAPYQKRTTGVEKTQSDMLRELEITKKQFNELKKYCESKGLFFLVTPFDEVSLEELAELNVAAYKISSTDITNIPLLRKIAKKGKPIILSTGMSYMDEVELALQEIWEFNKDVILLHCTSNYPVLDHEVNLNVLKTFQDKFEILVGYSDHTPGIGASPYAVPLGIKVLEKHFTLDKKMVGPDHEASLDIPELKTYIQQVRQVESYLGSPVKEPQSSEFETRKSLQKSFVAKTTIREGEYFTEENMVAKRCGGQGVSPTQLRQIIGTRAKRNFNKNEVIEI